MKCPKCKVTELETKNNQLYCPWCTLFFGQAKNIKTPTLNQKNINNTVSIASNQPEKETTISHGLSNNDDKEISPKTIFNNSYFTKIGFIVLFFIVVNLFSKIGNYNSLYPLCSIEIEKQGAKTNKPQITAALNDLKVSDQKNFKDVCRYIKKIGELSCAVEDNRTDAKSGTMVYKEYCYVKGTKTVYLNLEHQSDYKSVLLSLAQMSKDYWQN